MTSRQNHYYTKSELNHLLPLKNGKVIDLKTLEIRNKTDVENFNFELEFESLTDFSKVNIFFRNIFDNEDDIQFLQTQLGYCVTGELDDSMKNIIFFTGIGHGKTTLCDLLNRTLNVLCARLRREQFIEKPSLSDDEEDDNYDETCLEMANLIGKRLCTVQLNNSNEVDRGLLKQLIGRDRIIARKQDDNYRSYKLMSKYIFECNHFTETVSDEAWLKRIICVPFTKNLLSCENTNIDLNEFFSWLCVGASNYYKLGCKIPESILNATQNITHIEAIDRK